MNGGEPVPMERVARCCGWKGKRSKEFRSALFHSDAQFFLHVCYHRNTESLVVTEEGFLALYWISLMMDVKDPTLKETEKSFLKATI